jgi:peptide/nickel transport system permease protein
MASTTINVRGASKSGAALSAQPESLTAVVWRRFRKHRLAVISTVMLLSIFVMSLLAPIIAPFPLDHLDPTYKFVPFMTVHAPTGQMHILGTDHIGRDLFTRLLYGARITLTVAIMVAVLATVLGTLIGAIAGYYRGIVDTMLMRVLDFTSGIPELPILLILTSILLTDPKLLPFPDFIIKPLETIMLVREREARSVAVIVMVLTALGWTGIARLTRGMVLAVREADFVTASRSLGMSSPFIIAKHILPNAMAPVIVAFTQSLAGAFATETVLSFLGFGIQEPAATWGNMMANAENNIFENRVMPLVVGMPILICSLAFNFIGDGLRDALDPRLKM